MFCRIALTKLVKGFNRNGNTNTRIDITFRNVEAETFRNQADTNQQ